MPTQNEYEYDWLSNSNRLSTLNPRARLVSFGLRLSWGGADVVLFRSAAGTQLFYNANSSIFRCLLGFVFFHLVFFSFVAAVRTDKRKWFMCVCMRVNVIR